MSEKKIEIQRPFGPSVAKVKIPIRMIEILNNYVDKVILDKKKAEELDFGDQLAGNVKQEFRLEEDFLTSSGFLDFLASSSYSWISMADKKKITKFKILSCWIVRQFENEYNPIHFHSGHISGVGYLKLPKNLGEPVQSSKKINNNGRLSLIHGNRMFNSHSTCDLIPEVGDFYIFPHYMMHTVYPFNGSKDERRSISFNALIDENIYNVYGK